MSIRDKLFDYELVQTGTGHVNGNTVECAGETMGWDAFCAVRSTNGTISNTDDTVNVGEHVLTIGEYLAAREAHQGITGLCFLVCTVSS